MAQDISKQLEDQYKELQHYIDLLEKGECKAPDVKQRSALLGIYKERDNTYMCRVRRNAGVITAQNLRDTADIMDAQEIHHAHISTRQNIQLHGVPAANVYNTITSFNAAGMHFRGGGGNTFRCVATSPLSGVSPTETFDTIPHTIGVWDWVYYYERAYGFGRKLKLGFTSEEKDDSNAGIQDLGFVPKIRDGQRGFKVYGGGGMGRGANLGIVLFDFLPEKDVIRASQAVIDLFFEHGNREERSKARLRFRLQEWGEEKFRETYLDYFNKADAPDFVYEAIDYNSQVAGLKQGDETAGEGFEDWVKRSVKDTKFGDDIKSVRLYVRKGNFGSDDLRALADIVDGVGAPEVRSALSQDILIPMIHVSKLPYLYNALQEKLPEQAVTDGRFERHIVTCIGAAACPIGILKSPEAGDQIANALDDLLDEYEDIASEVYESIIDGINLSGCASSCGLNLIAGIGFHGQKKRINDVVTEVYQLHLGGQIDEQQHLLALTDSEWLVKADEIGEFVVKLVKEYLDSYRDGNKETLREFLVAKRDGFVFGDYYSL